VKRLPFVLVLASAALLGLLPVSGASGLLDIGTASGSGTWTLDGKPCDLIPTTVSTAAPVGAAETCPGVRPGAFVNSDVGQCTLNFLFQGSDGRKYIGTAGHCALEAPAVGGQAGERTWPAGSGPVATDADGNRIGEWAYAILQDPKDFSLIRLDPGVQSSPQMCHFGGPTGINNDTPGLDAPTVLQLFGNGVGIGTVLPARSMLALGMPDPDHVYAQGLVLPGDSGSGVTSADGRAIGVAVTTGLHTGSIGATGLDAGEVGITRLQPQLDRASTVLGIGLDLLTASTL
jgi:hypothetical protein